MDEAHWQECLATVARAEPRPQFIVASGSLPPGVPDDLFGRIAGIARTMDAKAIVDASGPSLISALKEGCYLIKPNLREFRTLTGIDSADETALIEAGLALIRQGRTEAIALTLGHQGALLIARECVLRADPLPIEAASVVGAGDSFLGAMVWSLTQNQSLESALRYGAAAGAAALLSPGTELCLPEDVMRLLPQVVVRPISPAGGSPAGSR